MDRGPTLGVPSRAHEGSPAVYPAGHQPRGEATRRQFLKVAGLGGAALGVGGVGSLSWRTASQGVFDVGGGSAYTAWGQWNTGTGPVALIRAAILAANPHNSQPWTFRTSASGIDLYADPTRNIGAMDPYRREQQIGLGCALENLMIAGQARGYAPQLRVLPDGDPEHIAHVELSTGAVSNTALFRAIPRRHTHRAPLDTSRTLSAGALAALDRAVSDISGAQIAWFTSDSSKRQVGDLIVAGAEAIAADRQQSVDSFKWWRDTWQDIQRFQDGMTLDAAGLSPLLTALAKILPPQTREQSEQAWIQQTRDNYVKTAAAFGFVVVHDASDPGQRINGGRLYQRLHLSAVVRGLAMQPLNTLTERIDREHALGAAPRFADAVAGLLPRTEGRLLMSFRIGYPSAAPSGSPRRQAEASLL